MNNLNMYKQGLLFQIKDDLLDYEKIQKKIELS